VTAIGLALLLLQLGAASTRPATTRSARDRESIALAKAVGALSTEFYAVMKDPEKPVRVECNYFKQNPSPDVTPAGILSICERRVAPTTNPDDVRIQAYVKWQLLSGVTDRFDDSLAKRAIEAYRRSPSLMIRPGISSDDRRELEAWARGHGEEDAETVEYKLDERVGRFNKYNMPQLRLRDALYERLPVRYESMLAALDDLSARLSCGVDEVDIAPLVKRLAGDAKSWLESSDPPPTQAQIASMARGVERLAKQRVEFYTGLKWNHEQRLLLWQTRSITADENGVLTALAAELNARASAAAAKLDSGR
jgi:hypothetical protein